MIRQSCTVKAMLLVSLAACSGGDDGAQSGAPVGQELAFHGEYTLVGGAPQLMECATGITYALLPEGQLQVMQEAYDQVSRGVDEPIQVSFTGRIEERSDSDGRPTDALVVVAFEAVHINEPCGATDPGPPLEATSWQAVTLMGSRITGDSPPTLALTPENGVFGWTGCRPVTGAYTLQGARLQFGALERPDLPCEGGLRSEQLYLSVLQGTGSYEMSKDTLRLVGESGVLGIFVGS